MWILYYLWTFFYIPNSKSLTESYVLQELIKKEQREMISNLISEDVRNLESNWGQWVWQRATCDNYLPDEWVIAGSRQKISLQLSTDTSLAGDNLHFLSSNASAWGLREEMGGRQSSELEA